MTKGEKTVLDQLEDDAARMVQDEYRQEGKRT